MPLLISPLGAPPKAIATHQGNGYAARLGRGGLAGLKREGDGRSPRGHYFLEYGLYRPDRLKKPLSPLPFIPITQNLGWCDDPAHHTYNTLVELPFSASHEKLWREDGLYDIILVISHNRTPPIKGKGSAIFLHCMSEKKGATEGCIAFEKPALLKLLQKLQPSEPVIFGL